MVSLRDLHGRKLHRILVNRVDGGENVVLVVADDTIVHRIGAVGGRNDQADRPDDLQDGQIVSNDVRHT